jgi:hypothetical protein
VVRVRSSACPLHQAWSRAQFDTSSYPTGLRITDRDMKVFEKQRLHRHDFHGD